jgi:hypothetical protein
MNRAARRRAGRRRQPRPQARLRLGHGPLTVDQLRCPDCNSDISITAATPGHWRAEVRHDASCPWYAQLKQDLR